MATNTFDSLTVGMAELLVPLQEAISSVTQAEKLLNTLGWNLPPNIQDIGLSGLNPVTVLKKLTDLKLAAGVEAEGSTVKISLYADLLTSVTQYINDVKSFSSSLNEKLPADYLSKTQIADQLPRRLLDYLVATSLQGRFAPYFGASLLLGFIRLEKYEADSVAYQSSHIRFVVAYDQFGSFFTNPKSVVADIYGWGTPTFNPGKALVYIGQLLSAIGGEGYLRKLPPRAEGRLSGDDVPTAVTTPMPQLIFSLKKGVGINPLDVGLAINGLRAGAPGESDAGLAIVPFVRGTTALSFPLGSTLSFQIDSTVDLTNGLALNLRPGQPLKVQSGLIGPVASRDITSGKIDFTIHYRRPDSNYTPLVVIPNALNLNFKEFYTSFGARIGATGKFNFFVEVGILKLRFQLATGGRDGFLSKILPGDELKADFDLVIGYTSSQGIYFQGNSSLEINMPVHFEFGPLSLTALCIAIRPASDGTISLEIAPTVRTILGPLTVVVERFGIATDFSFPSNTSGNLGLVNLSPRLVPPQGVGLSLNAGGFKGSGFLIFDDKKGEYAGALELNFQGFVSVKAIGIINTKMPDGSAGFSLLIIITAEFTPIQLSFGFTLNGVGGIIGLNRTLVVAALAEGIRTNAIKSILFPENIVENITRIISDIKQFFPPQDDHFVVGPMAKLGWGTPSIITLELGLLLDLPNPMFAIVGVLKAALPDESLPLLRLQVNFIGVLDFERGYVFFRADLYDSRLLIYSITGSMAFLVSWGEQQTFALSVGGFHPDFRDLPAIPALPNGFRNMARIGISLLSDDNPRLKIESYFAVTSNTVQFGARAELYAEAAGFNLYGFLGYDVLFQFDPFHFIADLYAGIALRRGSSVIAGINISAKLSGPSLWDARGDASLKILFIKISVGFHATWGDPPAAIAADTEDLMALLKRELADTRNWRAELPPNKNFGVTFKKIEPPVGEELLVIYPAGVLTFSQRSLPLEDYLIQKYGNKKPLKEDRFKLTNANFNGKVIPADFQGVREQFAPGNFTELNDSDKLSRKSFEQLPSGFKLITTSDLLVAARIPRPVRYELNYLRRKQFQLIFVGIFDLAARTYNRLVKSSAVRQSALSLQQTRKSLNAPADVHLPQEKFAIASMVNLRSHLHDGENVMLFTTQAEAYQKHKEIISQSPVLAGQIQVVSQYELNQD